MQGCRASGHRDPSHTSTYDDRGSSWVLPDVLQAGPPPPPELSSQWLAQQIGFGFGMKQAWLNQTKTCERLEITPQALRALHNEGVPHRRKGREVLYPHPRVREWYADFKERERQKRLESAKTRSDSAPQGSEAEERARNFALKNQELELKLAERRGDLMPTVLHLRVVEKLAERLTSFHRNLPSVWAPQLVGLDNEREVAKVLVRLADEAIEDMAGLVDDMVDPEPQDDGGP